MPYPDYLPHSFDKLLVWLNNFEACLDDKDTVARLALDADKILTVRKAADAFRKAFGIAGQGNAGNADRLNRREKADDAGKAVRYFVNNALRYNDRLTDEDRVNFGLKVPDRTLTHSKEPEEYPKIEVKIFVLRELTLSFINSATHRTGKPLQAQAIELCWAIVPRGEPASVKQLVNSIYLTRPRHTLKFGDKERGEVVGLCARYIGRRGQRGPFGPLIIAIIP
jgi:hypothetical protein